MQTQLLGIAIRAYRHGPMQVLPQAQVSCHSGVANDFRGKPSKRQVTLLSAHSWQMATGQLQPPPSWLTRRANLLVSHKVFTASDIGAIVHIGECLLEITQECDPCFKMDNALPGLQARLKPPFTAGVCCKVIKTGNIAPGDAVTFSAPPQQNLLF